MAGRLTRRESLGLGLAALVAGCGGGSGGGGAPAPPPSPPPPPPPPPAPPPPPPPSAAPALHQAAMARGMRFGSAIGNSGGGMLGNSFADANYWQVIVRECGLIVPENELKWQALRPGPTQFDFARADTLMAFAEANGLAMRGHTLMWHHPQWMPAWTTSYDYGPNPAAEAARLIREHVTTVCQRYAGRIRSWDAVNEAVDQATGGLRQTAFSQAMGSAEAVLDLVFATARQVLPDAQLVYNDFMGWEGGAVHRQGVLDLLAGFRARGIPVDALGVQSHLSVSSPDLRRDEAGWRRFLDQVVAMGYGLVITELDVNDNGLPADIAQRDQGVAAYARAYLDLMFSYPQLKDVMTWGMVDSFSWLQSFSPRADGQPKRPNPFDAAFQRKAMHQAIADAFAAATARP